MIEENNSLIKSTSDRIGKIENALTTYTQNIQTSHNEMNLKLNILSSENRNIKEILFKVSCDTQYSIFINENADIYERLRAFRNLMAFGYNGEVLDKGIILILHNKKEWREIEKHELKVEVANKERFDRAMERIRLNCFSDVA